MPHTLLRMLLILRPHLLQIFASHLIITGRAVGRCSRVGRLSVEKFVAIKRAQNLKPRPQNRSIRERSALLNAHL